VFGVEEMHLLISFLQAPMACTCRNIRKWCTSLEDDENCSCLAPGLFVAAEALRQATQVG
jgi:hypothetical protein